MSSFLEETMSKVNSDSTSEVMPREDKLEKVGESTQSQILGLMGSGVPGFVSKCIYW